MPHLPDGKAGAGSRAGELATTLASGQLAPSCHKRPVDRDRRGNTPRPPHPGTLREG